MLDNCLILSNSISCNLFFSLAKGSTWTLFPLSLGNVFVIGFTAQDIEPPSQIHMPFLCCNLNKSTLTFGIGVVVEEVVIIGFIGKNIGI